MRKNGYNLIKDNIVCPLDSEDGLLKLFSSCLEDNGLRTRHSRCLKLDNYIDKKNSLSLEEAKNIESKLSVAIVKYIAFSLYNECMGSEILISRNESIGNIIDGWDEKNPSIFITVNELKKIIDMDENEMLYILNSSLDVNNVNKFIRNACYSIGSISDEHFGVFTIYPLSYEYDSSECDLLGLYKNAKYSKRIYINSGLSLELYKFIYYYITKCVDERIPFDMKLLGSLSHNSSDLDGTILYSNNKTFNQHISIINEIIIEHPELMGAFGTPLYTGGQVLNEDGRVYYTICHGGLNNGDFFGTYNDYIDLATNITYIKCCCNLIMSYFSSVSSKLNKDIKLYSSIRKISNENISYELCKEIKHMDRSTVMLIRDIAYSIISVELDDFKKLMYDLFSNNFKLVCNAISFGNDNNYGKPIYMNEGFVQFDEKMKKLNRKK